MKTTLNLPDETLKKAKIHAAETSTTLRHIVTDALEAYLRQAASLEKKKSSPSALKRLRKGYSLGNKPLTREEAHAR
ncbi:MAG: hypothetical protein AAGC74_04300 [Verrucomicrobiota bacterium]